MFAGTLGTLLSGTNSDRAQTQVHHVGAPVFIGDLTVSVAHATLHPIEMLERRAMIATSAFTRRTTN